MRRLYLLPRMNKSATLPVALGRSLKGSKGKAENVININRKRLQEANRTDTYIVRQRKLSCRKQAWSLLSIYQSETLLLSPYLTGTRFLMFDVHLIVNQEDDASNNK